MFSTEHILYIVISLLVISGILFGMHYVKNQKGKNLFLFFVAMICFLFHISIMYVTLFENLKNGQPWGKAWDNMLLPIYFCNWVMYLLMAASLWPNKKSKFFTNFATFVAWGGTFGALITLFVVPPQISQWFHFQSALSHSCLLLGSLWLFVGGYAKINVFNLIPYTLGGISSAIVGGLVELVYFLNGLPPRNAMYMFRGPSEAPMFNGWILWIITSLIIFVFAVVWEFFKKKKEDRWYKSAKDIEMYLPVKIKTKNALAAESVDSKAEILEPENVEPKTEENKDNKVVKTEKPKTAKKSVKKITKKDSTKK